MNAVSGLLTMQACTFPPVSLDAGEIVAVNVHHTAGASLNLGISSALATFGLLYVGAA